MEGHGRSDFRLSGLTADALIKSSSASSPLLAPPQQFVPPMLPSLDAYLEAYRSLMSQDVQTMSALGGCGLGIRPPGLTMPVLPTAAAAAAAAAASLVSSPYYGLSPYSVDLARYGLLSPVYVPPFVAPFLCGGAGGAAGLLATPDPQQSSPATRSSSDRDSVVCPTQSFPKSLIDNCSAGRKNESAVTAVATVGCCKQPDTATKAFRRDPYLTDKAKPTIQTSPRGVATTEQVASDRKWNSSAVSGRKLDGADAVDFSGRRCSEIAVKSSVAGSSDAWRFPPASGASLIAGKNSADNSTHTTTNSCSYGAVSGGSSRNTVAVKEIAGDEKLDNGDKVVRNGEIQRNAGVKVDSSKVGSLIPRDQFSQRLFAVDESKSNHQSELSPGITRVTSSGQSDPDGIRATSDAGNLGSRRPSRPGGKKRSGEQGVALPPGPEVTPGDADGKVRNGLGSSSVEEFRCRLCNYSGRSQHCLSKHYRAHDLAYKICRYCRRAFERPSDLLRHEERHRRRDVLGSGGVSGSGVVDTSSDTVLSCSPADVSRQTAVGRIDSYADGTVTSSRLLSARLGAGDNEVILCFDEPAAEALVHQPAAPPPSKLRDVYSIMAGIFVNQHFLSFSQSAPVIAGSDHNPIPRAGVDEHGGALVPDFGQQAFLQMLDLKVVSEAGTATVAAAYNGSGHGQARGAVPAVTSPGAARERRRKGIPNRAIAHPISASDAADSGGVPVMAFCPLDDESSDVKLCSVGDADDVSPSFTACNGVVAGKSLKLGADCDGVRLAAYTRDRASSGRELTSFASQQDNCLYRRRSRKFLYISCKVCGKRLLEGSELRRHWLRHSVQDADGCYSCAACSFTSNVRLIMQGHAAQVHFVRRRSADPQSSPGQRCRLCAKPRRRLRSPKLAGVQPVWKRAEDCGLVKSLWCSDCTCRRSASRLLQGAWLRHNRKSSLRR